MNIGTCWHTNTQHSKWSAYTTLRGWRVQLPQRVGNNSISLCVQRHLPLCVRVRAEGRRQVSRPLWLFNRRFTVPWAPYYIGLPCPDGFTSVEMSWDTVLFELSYTHSWVSWFGGRVDDSFYKIGTLSSYSYKNCSPVGRLLGNFVACIHLFLLCSNLILSLNLVLLQATF